MPALERPKLTPKARGSKRVLLNRVAQLLNRVPRFGDTKYVLRLLSDLLTNWCTRQVRTVIDLSSPFIAQSSHVASVPLGPNH